MVACGLSSQYGVPVRRCQVRRTARQLAGGETLLAILLRFSNKADAPLMAANVRRAPRSDTEEKTRKKTEPPEVQSWERRLRRLNGFVPVWVCLFQHYSAMSHQILYWFLSVSDESGKSLQRMR
jgi:hypothetical protein